MCFSLYLIVFYVNILYVVLHTNVSLDRLRVLTFYCLSCRVYVVSSFYMFTLYLSCVNWLNKTRDSTSMDMINNWPRGARQAELQHQLNQLPYYRIRGLLGDAVADPRAAQDVRQSVTLAPSFHRRRAPFNFKRYRGVPYRAPPVYGKIHRHVGLPPANFQTSVVILGILGLCRLHHTSTVFERGRAAGHIYILIN